MTLAAVFVGAVLGVALGCVGLGIVGLIYVRSRDAIGWAEPRLSRFRRDAGGCGKCSRPAEPDRDAVLRVFRETGWVDRETADRARRSGL